MTIRATIQKLLNHLSIWSKNSINEAQTSQVMVLPILQALEFDIWNPFEVVAEDHSGGGMGGYCPDFVVRIDTETRFIVEVKALNKEFTPNDRTQAVNYVNALGRRWAVLTNGRLWHFYDNKVLQPAAEKLVLTVDVQDERAPNYLQKLLARAFWSGSDAEERLEELLKEVAEDIRKRQNLGAIEKKLRQELEEGFTHDKKGLKKAIELTLEPNERELAEEEFPVLCQRILALPATNGSETPVFDLIHEGIKRTVPRTRKSKASNLEAWIGDEKLPAVNWRDITAGLVESLILQGKVHELAKRKYIFPSMGERLRSSGEPYPPNSYRPLSNGQYVFLHMGAEGHQRRCKQLLHLLEAPKGIIRVRYEDDTVKLP